MIIINEDARQDHNKSVDWTRWTETVFAPTKAWMVSRHRELNAKYFSGKLTTPELEAKKLDAENGHRVFGWWWSDEVPKQYERDRKGRIIPSTVGQREVRLELALNTMFKGDDFFWESILLHEMCHQAVSELSDPEELAEVERKDKTDGHHELWQAWAESVTMDGKHVVTRFSDCKQEASMLAYLPDVKNNVIVFKAQGKWGICAVMNRFKEGVISTIMTTIFPDELYVYENSDPMFLSMRQSHRAIDYRVKGSKKEGYLEDMFIVSGEDNVFYYEWQANKDSKFMKLTGTKEDYDSPEYTFIIWTFESDQKAICKMPPGTIKAWRGLIELDTEDDDSVMKCQIDMLDFGSYRPLSRSTVRIKSMETVTTKGAPREYIGMPYVRMTEKKDSFGRPIKQISIYGIDDADAYNLVNDYNGVIDDVCDKSYYTKPGKKYAERKEEQWGVVVWRNEGTEDWCGWTVRGIHLRKIIECIKLTQNVEEGLALMFANENDLRYFNSYTELEQLRDYSCQQQGKDMLNLSEWAYNSTPKEVSIKYINSALSVSEIQEKIEFKSNIAENKRRYEKWASQQKYCVVWHTSGGDEYFTPTLESHIKHIKKVLASGKGEYKPVGNAVVYALPNTAMIELTKLGTNKAIIKNYFKDVIYKLSDDKDVARFFQDSCDDFDLDPNEEMRDSAESWWGQHISKPYSGSGLWKEIASVGVESAKFDTLCGVPLTDAGVQYIESIAKEIEVFKL